MHEPGTRKDLDTPGLATALRGCLGATVLFVEPAAGMVTLMPDAAELLRLPAGGRQSWNVLPAALRELAPEALQSRLDQRSIELSVGSGERIAVEVSAIPVGDPPHGVVLLLSQMDLLRQCEERLQRLDQLANLGTLAASMAHEIKNALVASKTFVDLLLEKNPGAELTDVVRRELARIEAIVARLLKFAGPARAQFSEFHVHELLDHTLRLLQPQLENRSITLHRNLQAAADTVDGDEGELQQALMNLLLNAVEAMSLEGSLTVSTKNEEGPPGAARRHIRVTITDTGIGIPPANLPHLFDPFFTTKASGTGLGLAVTKKIIQEHHGVLTVESRPGSGTSFHLLLPVAP